MSLLEMVREELDVLDETRLQQVADFVAFMRYQSRPAWPQFDEQSLSTYAEFGDEDRAMANEGMADYCAALAAEDAA